MLQQLNMDVHKEPHGGSLLRLGANIPMVQGSSGYGKLFFLRLLYIMYMKYTLNAMEVDMGNRVWKGTAHAKINLALDVRNRLPNGYHRLSMLMQTIDLADTVELSLPDAGQVSHAREATRMQTVDAAVLPPHPQPFISLSCHGGPPDLPLDAGNLAWKAAAAFFDCVSGAGVHIRLTKRIPAAAGLAGGSADAAAVLLGLNKLHKNPLTPAELAKLGLSLGADVPYCLHGGTCLAEGIGEILTPLPSFAGHWLVLVKPSVSVSTPWVFKHLDLQQLGERPDIDMLLQAIQRGDVPRLASGMRNVLESVTEPAHPEVAEIRRELLSRGSLGSRMSGSGPSVFGFFADEEGARAAQIGLSSRWPACWAVRTVDGPKDAR